MNNQGGYLSLTSCTKQVAKALWLAGHLWSHTQAPSGSVLVSVSLWVCSAVRVGSRGTLAGLQPWPVQLSALCAWPFIPFNGVSQCLPQLVEQVSRYVALGLVCAVPKAVATPSVVAAMSVEACRATVGLALLLAAGYGLV
jgi:hypothetical protein